MRAAVVASVLVSLVVSAGTSWAITRTAAGRAQQAAPVAPPAPQVSPLNESPAEVHRKALVAAASSDQSGLVVDCRVGQSVSSAGGWTRVLPAAFCEVRNQGKQSFLRVDVTTVGLDGRGRGVFEKTVSPVLFNVMHYGWRTINPLTEPDLSLDPRGVRRFQVLFDDPPGTWAGKVEAYVTRTAQNG